MTLGKVAKGQTGTQFGALNPQPMLQDYQLTRSEYVLLPASSQRQADIFNETLKIGVIEDMNHVPGFLKKTLQDQKKIVEAEIEAKAKAGPAAAGAVISKQNTQGSTGSVGSSSGSSAVFSSGSSAAASTGGINPAAGGAVISGITPVHQDYVDFAKPTVPVSKATPKPGPAAKAKSAGPAPGPAAKAGSAGPAGPVPGAAPGPAPEAAAALAAKPAVPAAAAAAKAAGPAAGTGLSEQDTQSSTSSAGSSGGPAAAGAPAAASAKPAASAGPSEPAAEPAAPAAPPAAEAAGGSLEGEGLVSSSQGVTDVGDMDAIIGAIDYIKLPGSAKKVILDMIASGAEISDLGKESTKEQDLSLIHI